MYLFIFIGNNSASPWKCEKPHTPNLNTVQQVNQSLNTAETNKSN